MANKPQQWKVSNRLYNMLEQISSVQIYLPSYQKDKRKAKYMEQDVKKAYMIEVRVLDNQNISMTADKIKDKH